MVIKIFPSFSVKAIAPVSAIKKLAPVTPTLALVNFSRNNFRVYFAKNSGVESAGVLNFS